MIKQLLTELNIEIKAASGEQYIADCPFCSGKKHFYINKTTGAWDCKHGCGEGYPYQLVRDITHAEPKQIFSTLAKYNLAAVQAEATQTEEAARKIKLPEEAAMAFCAVKQISVQALEKLFPMYSDGIVYIPFHNPGVKKPAGYIRASVTGELVRVGSGAEKYPVTAKSKPGLLGIHGLRPDEPIYYVEGWKDLCVALSLNLNAISPSNGASCWSDDWLPVFVGRDVVTVFDRDTAGVSGVKKLTTHIGGVVKSIKHIELPYEITAKSGKDLWDFIITDKGDISTCKTTDTIIDEADKQVILADDYPDTIARAFEDYSRKVCGVLHRYHSTDGWSIYSNDHYQRVESVHEIEKYLSNYMAKCYFTDNREKTQRIKISNCRINDVMKQLACLDGVHLRPSQSAPCSLTGELDPENILNLKNGLLDYGTYPYVLHPHTSDYYSFSQLPYGWEGEIESDMWLQFLFDTLNNDVELFDLLEQWGGYCINQHDRSRQKFMLIYGEAGTGKSVFCDVLLNLIGEGNYSTVSLANFDDKHSLFNSYGKMLNYSEETSRFMDENVENIIKNYTGGTPMDWNQKYKPSFSAYPTAKIMISTNHKPTFKDTSDGLWRRLLLVPFENVVPESKQIDNLQGKIIATEMPGVLCWALEGIRKLKKCGFIKPTVSEQLKLDYKRNNIPEIGFLEDTYASAGDEDYVTCDSFRSSYEAFCKQEGIHAKSLRVIGETLRKVYPKCEKKRARIDGILCNVYANILDRNSVNYTPENEVESW